MPEVPTTAAASAAGFLDRYEHVTFDEAVEADFKQHLFGASRKADEERARAGVHALAGDADLITRFRHAVLLARRFQAALAGTEDAQDAAEEQEAAGAAAALAASDGAAGSGGAAAFAAAAPPKPSGGSAQPGDAPAVPSSGAGRGGRKRLRKLHPEAPLTAKVAVTATIDLVESGSDNEEEGDVICTSRPATAATLPFASGAAGGSSRKRARPRQGGAAADASSGPAAATAAEDMRPLYVNRSMGVDGQAAMWRADAASAGVPAERVALFEALVAADAPPAFAVSSAVSNLWNKDPRQGLLATLVARKPVKLVSVDGPVDSARFSLFVEVRARFTPVSSHHVAHALPLPPCTG